MNFNANGASNINIAYIGGGSRGWAWSLMSDLAMEENMSGTVRLYDIDFNAAKDNETIGNSLYNMDEVKGKWKYEAVRTLEEALSGADFVIISILPGTFKEMQSDVHEPEKYGIYQPVGDTIGPGGIVRALRTIPMFIEITENIKKYSPNAWVINYTNPMTICVRTMYEVFPGIKAIGCCHEVFGTQKLLMHALKEIKGINAESKDSIKVNVLGINHFTWLDSASYKNIDLMPVYKEFVDKYYETGYLENKEENWIKNTFVCAHRVKFDLFRRYGIIAAAGDRHLAEFVPGTWYLKDPETVHYWKFGLTPVSWRLKDLENRLEKSKNLVSGKIKFTLKQSGELGVKIIKALLGFRELITNVNFVNRGQAPDLPKGSIVETNALFSRDSVRPLFAGCLPEGVRSLVEPHLANHEIILDAAIHKDKNKAFTAFINDPQLSRISLDDAWELFNSMLANTKDYLPGWDI